MEWSTKQKHKAPKGEFIWKQLAKKEPEFVLEQFPLHFIEAINNTNGENLQYPTIEHQ